jgi:hypothetical protein
MPDYTALRDTTATPAIRDNGIPAILYYGSGGFMDHASGKYDTPPTPNNADTHVLRLGVKERRIDGVVHRRLQVLLAASGLAVEPTPDMTLEFGGTEYPIDKVEPLAPGAVDVMYTLDLRL